MRIVLVERNAADGVVLLEHQVGQAGGERAGVFVLVQRPAAVPHAVRDVDQQRAAQVRVFFELLDVQAVLPRPDLPVDVPQIVAGHVFAMLQELDRLAEVRTAVHPRKESFDDVPGPQFQPRDPLDRFRMQKSF